MGTPSPGWDSLVRQASVAARRRKRRRRQRRMLWVLTGATTAVLVVIALFIMHISKIPTKVRPAALSASTRTVSHGNASGTAHRAKPSQHHPGVVTYPQVSDASSGLSYRLLGSPWQRGCPSDLNTTAFDWTAGENTVAGRVSIGGSVIDWHGLACSGQLQQQFGYSGPADLEPTATSLASALDPAYYAGVQHSSSTVASAAIQVSGHQAWKIEFAMSYPDGASQGLTWSTELGAVVVVDRGADQFPAVFYVSVPASLGTQNVAMFLSTLRVS
jgi:hypothetical protein